MTVAETLASVGRALLVLPQGAPVGEVQDGLDNIGERIARTEDELAELARRRGAAIADGDDKGLAGFDKEIGEAQRALAGKKDGQRELKRRLGTAEREAECERVKLLNVKISAHGVAHTAAVEAVEEHLAGLIEAITAQLAARESIAVARRAAGLATEGATETRQRIARCISGRLVAIPDLAWRLTDMTGDGYLGTDWGAREIAMGKTLLIPTTAETANG